MSGLDHAGQDCKHRDKYGGRNLPFLGSRLWVSPEATIARAHVPKTTRFETNANFMLIGVSCFDWSQEKHNLEECILIDYRLQHDF